MPGGGGGGGGGQNIEARGREATWLLLKIPNILVQLEGRGPAKVGCEG